MDDSRLSGRAGEAFLSACCALARDAVLTPTWFEPAVTALSIAWGESPQLIAPTFVLDVMALASGERLNPTRWQPSEPLRSAARAYEDHVLARLVQDRRWLRLCEALAGAPAALRPTAVGLLTTQLFARLGVVGGAGISQAQVRRLATRSSNEVAEEGRHALAQAHTQQQLADGFLAFAKAARGARELLSDAEIFLTENIAALKGLGPRIALVQLANVSQALFERLPARVRGQVFEDGDAPTALEEDSSFPVGGFSSISTSGTLENLVTSELIYMDGEGAARPDLFDVRFVEGELLYFSRDESVSVRRRRRMTFIFDASLASTRLLDPTERYQRLVWVLGAVSALVRKLAAWFDSEALSFELAFAGDAEGPLHEEAAVMALMLRDLVERGQVTVRHVVDTATAAVDARQSFTGLTRVVVFSVKWPSGLDGKARPDAVFDVATPLPVVHWVDGKPAPAVQGGAEDAWHQGVMTLVDGFVRMRRGERAAR